MRISQDHYDVRVQLIFRMANNLTAVSVDLMPLSQLFAKVKLLREEIDLLLIDLVCEV